MNTIDYIYKFICSILCMKKPCAVIDTSFWVHLVYLDIDNYLIKYFNIYFPNKVKSEILYFKHFDYFYKSTDISVFERLLQANQLTIKDPKQLIDSSELQKDSGEHHLISLAKENSYGVFIDDGIPYDLCSKMNILRMNSVDFIIFLYIKKEITKEKGIELMIKLSHKIKQKYIEEGIKFINNIKR